MKRITLIGLVLIVAVEVAATQNQGLVLVNGSSANVEAPVSATLIPQSGITLEAWVTYDGSTLGTGYRWPTVVRKNLAAGQESFILRVGASNTKNTNLEWHVVTSSGRMLLTWAFMTGQLNTWTHLAVTYDGAVGKIFVNGVESANRPWTGNIVDNGGVFRIGEGNTSAAPGIETWNGRIDEVRLWPFARTAAEIQSTMQLELSSVPGEVSTWNLNGNGTDSSGTNNAVANLPGLFSGLALTLNPVSLSGTKSFGAGTAGCLGTPLIGVSSTPDVGNSAFAFTCVRGTATGAGVFGMSTTRLQNPLNVGGAGLWIFPNGLTFNVPGGTFGSVRTNIPIPNVAQLVGQIFYTQYFWTEATCQTTIFASDGLETKILP